MIQRTGIFVMVILSMTPSHTANIQLNPRPIVEYGEHLGEAFVFQKLTAITITDDDYIWVVDRDQNCIFKFDFDGNQLAKLGQRGQGPGEFHFPTDVMEVDGKIWVADFQNGRIQVLKDLQYEKMIKLDNPTSPKSFLKTSENIFVGGFYYINNVSTIAKLDHQGNFIDSIDTIDVPDAPHQKTAGLWRIFELIGINESEIVLGFNFDSLIVKGTTAGETTLVKPMNDFYEATETPGGPLITPGHLLVSSFAAGPKGTLLMTICDHEIERNDCSVIYQLSGDLKSILNRWDVGESVRAMHYDEAKGLLATVTAEKIKIYEFK